ncbi:replication initiation protein [Pantoea endophytica]|uniref:Replication initiation protein n=1 Tax=Pantoea sp. BJ2 TaxID=3141322 RepID=A0AAU7U552_9GAMM
MAALSGKRISVKTKIRHRNEINNTFSALPLSARRILFMAMAQLDSKSNLKSGQMFKITAKEYAVIADVDLSVAYKQMKEGAELLQSSLIKIPKSQLMQPEMKAISQKDAIWRLNLTDFCSYSENESSIIISFGRTIEPYICQLKDNYTTQVLFSAVRLSDTNASSLYQLIRKYISAGCDSYFEILIDDLKDQLSLYKEDGDDKIYLYPDFKIFNRSFLKKNISVISEFTEIKMLNVEVVSKLDRKASKLRFSYKVDKESEGSDYRIPEGFRS